MKRVKVSDADKPWAVRAKTGRAASGRFRVKNLFRIFCEGENTEPLYLKGFPVIPRLSENAKHLSLEAVNTEPPDASYFRKIKLIRYNTETHVEVVGLGRGKSALVREVISRLKRDGMLSRQENYDADRQIWVVFDMDCRGVDSDFADFDQAVALASQHGLRVAWSNDAFELWFVLHYKYLDSALSREQYYELLSGYLCHDYKSEGKRKDFCTGLYKRLLADQAVAIRNASKLFESWHSGVPFSKRNPSTAVFHLVAELNRCLKP